LAQRRLVARINTLIKAYIGKRDCNLRRDDHNWKIRNSKQKTNVGKYSFVNRTLKSWNQVPAGLLASFLRKLNTFKKRVKKVITRKGIQVGGECK